MIYFYLCLACPLGVFVSSVKYPSHSMYKPAEQSSTLGTQTPNFANDANTVAAPSLCSETTGNDLWNWWMVDMEKDFTIKSFRIAHCCNRILRNFSIEVSTENPKTLDGFPGLVKNASVCLFQTESVPTNYAMAYHCDQPATGRYVRLVQHNPTLQKLLICELDVYSYHESNDTYYAPADDNIARSKPTFQDTTAFGGESSRAVDGNLDGIFTGRSCTYTPGRWWMVDLEQVYVIDTFRAVNRVDAGQYRFGDFIVEVSMDDPRTYDGFPGNTSKASTCLTQIDPINYGAPVTLQCDRPVVGRYVRIVKQSNEMTICEFEVFELKEHVRFEYIGGSQAIAGSVDENSPEARHYTVSCTRQFMRSITAMHSNGFHNPFIHVDLVDGKCRFLDNFQDSKDIASSNWVVYRYE